MEIRRLTRKKDHIEAKGKMTFNSHLFDNTIIIAVEDESNPQYNRVILTPCEAVTLFKALTKHLVKSWVATALKHRRNLTQ